MSQTIRKRIEESSGWSKEIGLIGRIRVRGRERIDVAFTFTTAAFNLVRLPKFLGA
jgi:hypothetical protein